MGKRSVLVVDDDADIRDTLCDLLESEGYAVSSATNGAEALTRIHAGVHVLVTDLMMPLLDGWGLVAQVRSRPDLAPVRVIVITAGRPAEVRGADELLLKPFALETLLSSVDRLCHA